MVLLFFWGGSKFSCFSFSFQGITLENLNVRLSSNILQQKQNTIIRSSFILKSKTMRLRMQKYNLKQYIGSICLVIYCNIILHYTVNYKSWKQKQVFLSYLSTYFFRNFSLEVCHMQKFPEKLKNCWRIQDWKSSRKQFVL